VSIGDGDPVVRTQGPHCSYFTAAAQETSAARGAAHANSGRRAQRGPVPGVAVGGPDDARVGPWGWKTGRSWRDDTRELEVEERGWQHVSGMRGEKTKGGIVISCVIHTLRRRRGSPYQ
jgi:hypothetical protein